jgi:hypothetical protein
MDWRRGLSVNKENVNGHLSLKMDCGSLEGVPHAGETNFYQGAAHLWCMTEREFD